MPCRLTAATALLLCGLSAGAHAQGAGFTLELSPEHSAYALEGAPGAIVHAPPGFDPRPPLHLVVFLHGYSGCARVLMGTGSVTCRPGDAPRKGWDLARRHDEGERNTLFVIPQLAFMKRDGKPGCFGKRGCFKRFLGELLAGPLAQRIGAPRTLRDVASITLVAHSAGFQTALAILEQGGVERLVHNVILMDALYARARGFAHWVTTTPVKAPRLLSIYLGDGKTSKGSRELYRSARRKLGGGRVAKVGRDGIDAALRTHTLVIAAGRAPHRLVPENYLARVLKALDLPAR